MRQNKHALMRSFLLNKLQTKDPDRKQFWLQLICILILELKQYYKYYLENIYPQARESVVSHTFINVNNFQSLNE